MELDQVLLRLGVALGCGLVLGIERGWTTRGEERGQRLAGVRTFSLTGLAGGLVALLALEITPRGEVGLAGAILLAVGLAATGAAFTTMRALQAARQGGFGSTTLIAVLGAYILGALAVVGDMRAPVAAAAAAALVLNAKPWLHRFVSALSEAELRAALRLLAMSAILLPILPRRGFGPFEAINPFEIWLIVVLISAVSFAGYIAVRTAGPSRGPIIAAGAGGLVSSTAVTVAFARRARESPDGAFSLAAGVGLAGVVMYGRMAGVAITIAPALASSLAVTLGPPALAGALVTAALGLGSARAPAPSTVVAARNPFDLAMALRLGGLLALTMLAVAALRAVADPRALYVLAFLSGLADVDAATLSFARNAADRDLAAHAAGLAIGLVGLADTLTKIALAIGLARGRARSLLAAPLIASAIAGVAALAWAGSHWA